MSPRALVLRAPGSNCDEETVHAFELAGASAERIHVNRVLERPGVVREFQILCIPGGFSYGDDIAAGRIFSERLRQLADTLESFHNDGNLILGICNGFQVLLKTSLLIPMEAGPACATLAWNVSGRFEDRWVSLLVSTNRCPFMAGIETLDLPIAHAEGRFVVSDEQTFDSLEASGQLALRYRARKVSSQDASGQNKEVIEFPDNPNGSQRNVAGLCDLTGRILGLMPHPERYVTSTQHPQWTRSGNAPIPGDGLRIFRNAVRYFS